VTRTVRCAEFTETINLSDFNIHLKKRTRYQFGCSKHPYKNKLNSWLVCCLIIPVGDVKYLVCLICIVLSFYVQNFCLIVKSETTTGFFWTAWRFIQRSTFDFGESGSWRTRRSKRFKTVFSAFAWTTDSRRSYKTAPERKMCFGRNVCDQCEVSANFICGNLINQWWYW